MIFEISYFAMALCIDFAAYYSSQMLDDSWNITCQLYLESFSLQKIGTPTLNLLIISI